MTRVTVQWVLGLLLVLGMWLCAAPAYAQWQSTVRCNVNSYSVTLGHGNVNPLETGTSTANATIQVFCFADYPDPLSHVYVRGCVWVDPSPLQSLKGPSGATLSNTMSSSGAIQPYFGTSAQTVPTAQQFAFDWPLSTTFFMLNIPITSTVTKPGAAQASGAYSASSSGNAYAFNAIEYDRGDLTGKAPATCGNPVNNAFTVTVNAQAAESCQFVGSASSLNFGAVDGLMTAPKDVIGAITVKCPSSVAFSVSLGAGQNASGTQRRLKNAAGADYMNYDIYTDSYSTKWTPTTKRTGTGTGGNQTVNVYGRIPVQNKLKPAASYTDAVTVTLEF